MDLKCIGILFPNLGRGEAREECGQRYSRAYVVNPRRSQMFENNKVQVAGS